MTYTFISLTFEQKTKKTTSSALNIPQTCTIHRQFTPTSFGAYASIDTSTEIFFCLNRHFFLSGRPLQLKPTVQVIPCTLADISTPFKSLCFNFTQCLHLKWHFNFFHHYHYNCYFNFVSISTSNATFLRIPAIFCWV